MVGDPLQERQQESLETTKIFKKDQTEEIVSWGVGGVESNN